MIIKKKKKEILNEIKNQSGEKLSGSKLPKRISVKFKGSGERGREDRKRDRRV